MSLFKPAPVYILVFKQNIGPKNPAFLRPMKPSRLHLLPSRISNYTGGGPPDPPPIKRGDTPLSDSPPAHAYGTRGHAYSMSSLRLLPKILHLLKYFLRTLVFIPVGRPYLSMSLHA